MRTTSRPSILAALLIIVSLGLAVQPATAQLSDEAKRGMTLTIEPLDLILRDLQNFDFKDVGPLMRLRASVFARKGDPQARQETEEALLEFVQGSPAPGGLMAACRALRLIGGPASVPVLAALALKAETTDPARYALERIPGGEADQALVAALDKTQGDVRRGIIFSLGERRTGAAVPALAKLAAGKDTVLAADAIKALGKIGGPEATKSLTALLGKSATALKPEVASALLLAAEGLLKSGDKAAAAVTYEKVFAASVSPISRQAAFKGQIAAGPGPEGLTPRGRILGALIGKDVSLYPPALAAIPDHFGPTEIVKVAELLERLPASSQVQLATVMAKYPADVVRPYLLKAAESPSQDVRLAALRSLTTAGDGKSVIFLATRAARTAGVEKEMARDALARMRGSDVDAAVLDHLSNASDEAVETELVRAAGARHIAGAKPRLIELVKSGSPALRTRAAAALRTISSQVDIPGLLDLLGGLDDEAARESMEDTIAAAARTNPRELVRAGEVETRLAGEKDARKRADLLRVLGKIGDDSALSMVRDAVDDSDEEVADAAVRALAEWPTIAPRDDVLEIARTSLVLNHRVLAIRAYVRMIGLEPNRAPEGAAEDLLKVLALSPRPEEKKLVLGMLGRFPCVTSLKTAESLLAEPDVAAEAKLAADRIRRALK